MGGGIAGIVADIFMDRYNQVMNDPTVALSALPNFLNELEVGCVDFRGLTDQFLRRLMRSTPGLHLLRLCRDIFPRWRVIADAILLRRLSRKIRRVFTRETHNERFSNESELRLWLSEFAKIEREQTIPFVFPDAATIRRIKSEALETYQSIIMNGLTSRFAWRYLQGQPRSYYRR